MIRHGYITDALTIMALLYIAADRSRYNLTPNLVESAAVFA